MKTLTLVLLLVIAPLVLSGLAQHKGAEDPCDAYGDCLSSTIVFIRSNADHTLYLGDSFAIPLSVSTGANTSGYRTSWSFDSSVFDRTGTTFTVTGNRTGTFTIMASVTFTGLVRVGNTTRPFTSTLATFQTVTVIPMNIEFDTRVINVTGLHGGVLRNPDGSFYPNDSLCDSWNATFLFAGERTDININVTSNSPRSLQVLNYSDHAFGRMGRFCYVVRHNSTNKPFDVVLVARALNWQGTSLGLKESGEPFAVVRYDPHFTSYSYMLYGNSTASNSLQRPWVLFVRYDGNLPGYSYGGNKNTRPFNGSRTLAERAFFSDFQYTTLSYQAYTTGGVFRFHVLNSTGAVEYNWLNKMDSAPLDYSRRIVKYVFDVTASSLTPLLSQGFIYQNITIVGCWQHERVCDLRQNYWLVPFLWNGRLNVVSVDSNGNLMPSTPLTVTMRNPAPLDDWLTGGFERVFGSDAQALKAFKADLYPTDQTMSFSGSGRLGVWLNQTSLSPPMISITAGGVSLAGNFTFVPTFVNSTIASVPNSLNGTVYYANATIPLWSYNMIKGSLTYLPISTTIVYPSSFLALLNSSGWVAGNTTSPQTPSAFASQRYGFWPMGESLTVYVNTEGGGIELLGTQKLGPNEYQATFYIEAWSGGISSVQILEGNVVLSEQSTLSTGAYPSPLPTALTGLYTTTFQASQQDMKIVFTNIWGAKTTLDLSATPSSSPSLNLIPETTIAAFGVALFIWFVVNSVLKTKKISVHE